MAFAAPYSPVFMGKGCKELCIPILAQSGVGVTEYIYINFGYQGAQPWFCAAQIREPPFPNMVHT